MEERREKIKKFLETKLEECEKIIRKRKRKNRRIKILFFVLVSTSIIGSSTVTILSSLAGIAVPHLVIACVSGITAITSGLSISFRLEDRKNTLLKSIQELHRVRDKLDYVIHCNGNLTEEECSKTLHEFRCL